MAEDKTKKDENETRKRIREQEEKKRQFNKLEEWEKQAVIADKERRAELNKQWEENNQNPYSSLAKKALLGAGTIGASNILLHRTGLHQKINKPLAKFMRAKKAMSMKTGNTPWYKTTISDWRRMRDTFKEEWKKAGDTIDKDGLRINTKKKNSFFDAMIHAKQVRENGRAIATEAWNFHVESTMMEKFDKQYLKEKDHNRRNKFAIFIRNVSKEYNSPAVIHRGLKQFTDPDDIKLAKQFSDEIYAMNREKFRVDATADDIANKVHGLVKDGDKYYVEKSVKEEFLNKEAAKSNVYADLLENVKNAREYHGHGKSAVDFIRGTRKATMKDIIDNLDNIEDFNVRVASYTEDNKKTMNLVSIKDIIKENYEKAKEQGLEKEFLSITPDSEIRIGSSGKLYSAEGTESFINEILEGASDTLPGKILKMRDKLRSSDQPTYNLALKGSLDPVLAAATNNTIESKKSARMDNTIFKAYDRWYKIDDNGEAKELEWMKGRYNIASGKSNFLYRQIQLMHDDARRIDSDNSVMHWFDLREDRDEYDNKSFVGKLWARMPWNKDEYSRNRIFDDAVKPSEGFTANHIAGLKEINSGDNSYAYEIAQKIATIQNELNENTYEMSDKVIEQLQTLVNSNSYAGQILDALRETDEKKLVEKINNIQQDMINHDQNFVDKDLLSWLNRQNLDQNASFNEYQVITGRSHGQIGSDLSTSYDNESLKGADLIKKKLGKEALLQVGAELSFSNGVDKANPKLFDSVFEALDNIQDVSAKDRQYAKNLATDAIFNMLYDSSPKSKFGQVMAKNEAKDYVDSYFEFATNRKNQDFVDEMKQSLKNISDENFSNLDTYYSNVDEVGNPLSYNSNIAIHRTTGILDIVKSMNDAIKERSLSGVTHDISHFFTQFFAGRSNMEDVSYGTMMPFFALTRLNEVGRVFGIGFSSRSMSSTLDLMSNIMLKRVVPATVGMTYLDWANDTSQEITGQSFTGAGLRGLAQTDVMIRRGMDAIGLTDWLKEEKEINPIMQYWGDKNAFYNADELQNYYDNGYTPVRKGAYWTFGSVNELRGGEISYWAPTWVRKAESDYKDKALYDGYFDKWSHSLLPTPSNPLSPIMGILDPYWLEEKHEDDRPYPVSGQLFDEGTPLGIVLNPTLGSLIKPQKELHPWRMRNGVDIYSAMYQANEWIKDKAASIGKRNYFTYDGADVSAVTFNAWNAPTSDTSVLSINFSGGQYSSPITQTYGVYDEEDGSFGSIYAAKSGQVSMSGGFGTSPSEGLSLRSIFYDSGVPSYLKGEGYTKITSANAAKIISNGKLDKDHAIITGLDNSLGYVSRENSKKITEKDGELSIEDSLMLDSVINGDENSGKEQTSQLIKMIRHPMSMLNANNRLIKNKAASIKSAGMNDFDDDQGFMTAQKLKGFTPSQGMELLNDADTVAELINQGKGSSLVHDIAVSQRLITGIYGYMSGETFGIGTDQEKKIATSQDMTSTSRAFWDSGIGGAGGSTAEIIRRFIPDFRRRTHINPMLNEMPDWLPERFKTGDPFTSVIDGEARLPGKGYEALNKLHPDAYGEYGAFDRFKILADIAPFSPEYKLWKQIAAKTISDPMLIQEMDEIRDRVAQQGKKHDFYNNNLINSGVVYKEVVITDLMGYGKFKSGDQVYKLAGISLKTDGQTSMQDTLGKYLRIGDKVTIAIDRNGAYQTNKDTQSSINAAVYRDGENINRQMIEAGDAKIRKGDTSAPAFLGRYSGTQRAIAAISEKIGHLDIPWLSDQYLRIRSPLESYDAEVLYGTPYQTWSHPIDTFLMPAITRAFHDVNIGQGITTYIYNKVSETPGIGRFSKAGATAAFMFTNRGAFIGGALGAITGFRQSSIETGARIGQMVAQAGHILTGGNSYFDAALNGSAVGYEIATRLEKNKTKGALIGAAASTLYRTVFGDKGTWKPDYVKKKWEMEEYFDRLTYLKYEALYHEAARKAKEEEDVDVEELVKERDDQYELSKKIRSYITSIQKELKAKTYDKETDQSKALKKTLQGILNKVDTTNDEIFEGGEWTRAVLLYRKAAKATVYAMNSNTSWGQMVAALPKNDREYFMEFVKERDQSEREKILDHVSPSLNKALRLAWKMDVPKQESNEEYFEKHNLPTPYWTGWNPNTDMDDIQIKTVQNEGMNLSDFGYYESQLETEEAKKAPPINTWNKKNASAEDVKTNLKRILNGKGLKNVDISVEPTIGGSNIIASIKKWAGIKENQDRVDDIVKDLAV